VYFQNSMIRDDDNADVNGELDLDELVIGENPASSLEKPDSQSAAIDDGAFHGNNFIDETNHLPSIRISPRVYGETDDDDDKIDDDMNDHKDDDNDKEVSSPDDIYNFEFSDDQKQAIQELFNLKLDLGFVEG